VADRARALVLFASGMPRTRRIVADSLRRFVPRALARPIARSRLRQLRSIFADEYDSLSYAVDWRDAFAASPRLDAVMCNVNDALALAAAVVRMSDFDLVIALHSAAGDSLLQLERVSAALVRRRGPLLVLFGNEYDDMASKRNLLVTLRAEYVGSQLPIDAANWLYHGCGAVVLPAPAGLNVDLYRPGPADRPIDIGFRGDRYHVGLIGDDERVRAIERVTAHAATLGLSIDVAFMRLPRRDWSAFLARCLGTVGAEAGTYYLERDDVTRTRAARYLAAYPDAPLADVLARCYPERASSVSGKAISSRHLEAVGTKTCQILVSGRYNDILRAGDHYIAVKPDMSDVGEGVRMFNDSAYRTAVADRAYEHVSGAHTYAHRVTSLLSRVLR